LAAVEGHWLKRIKRGVLFVGHFDFKGQRGNSLLAIFVPSHQDQKLKKPSTEHQAE
jgi:hypothetical protein